MKIELIKPTWKRVFQIPEGTIIIKGRHGIYKDARAACRQVTNRFGCYSWQSAEQVYYCGKFKDYGKPEYKSNLEGRFCNYWENHNGTTNKHVFDLINTTLDKCAVELAILEFNSLELENESASFADFCSDSDLVNAVEELLICHYRRLKQSSWNRT